MTPEDCVAHGGHCWADPPDVPAPALQIQVCRHCPADRRFVWDGRRWTVTYKEEL